MRIARQDAAARNAMHPLTAVPAVPVNPSEGHKHDEGRVQRAIGNAVNGSPDILATVCRMTPHQYHPLQAHRELGELYSIWEDACEVRVRDKVKWVEAQAAIFVPAAGRRAASGGTQIQRRNIQP